MRTAAVGPANITSQNWKFAFCSGSSTFLSSA